MYGVPLGRPRTTPPPPPPRPPPRCRRRPRPAPAMAADRGLPRVTIRPEDPSRNPRGCVRTGRTSIGALSWPTWFGGTTRHRANAARGCAISPNCTNDKPVVAMENITVQATPRICYPNHHSRARTMRGGDRSSPAPADSPSSRRTAARPTVELLRPGGEADRRRRTGADPPNAAAAADG